jgi:ABC-type phosphate transport system substrate-binding protein
MKRFIYIAVLLCKVLVAQELVVIANKNFSNKELTVAEIRAIFLDKKRFINNEKLLVMNYKVNHTLRTCFEKKILKKSKRSLERYWRKAYYKGHRPPKIIKSTEMLFSYLENVSPSIGYTDKNNTLKKNVTILFSVTCD